MSTPFDAVLAQIRAERDYQDRVYGEQHLPDGAGTAHRQWQASNSKVQRNIAIGRDELTWTHLLEERTDRALASTTDDMLFDRLVKVAAVSIAWAEDLLSRERSGVTA
ncbi:hypothetical protein [Kineococcus esterisolvens]|uniref:hypothetical protein n=1 Tax=unclassified Kineococcus TaxID=2621656 RepID=UPI003D7E9491